MIFLKKIFSVLTALLSAAALLTGCSDKDNRDKTEKSSAVSSEESVTDSNSADASSEAASEPQTVHEIHRDITKAEGTYVYDYAKLLSKDAFEECNNYTEWLYENFLINAAVITVDDLEGMSPEEYAEKAYIDLYSGRGSGLSCL